MTEILILYILMKYDATIYKIKKLMTEKFFCYISPSLGAINPALKKLEGLSCVEFNSFMSEGGLLSKTYKITPFGVKYLKNLITSFEFKSRAKILNNAALLICVSDILDEDEKKEVTKNCINHLLILKTEITNAIESPYTLYTPIQQKTVQTNLTAVNSLLEVLQ